AEQPALARVTLDALAPKLLRRLARGLRGGAGAIGGGREKLHRLRKRTRRLRDAMAALAPEPDDRATRRLFAATRRLTAALGEANDAANAVALAERLGGPRGAGPAPAALLSDWASRRERAALRGFGKSWRRLRARRERVAG
ncbi:MAG: CHAD domain-containing protein, partial [Rhodospirillales bacterium]|nr:CHAD domain-containing protein [Rhodospirillales bacterium]